VCARCALHRPLVGTLITLGVSMSAVGCLLACVVGAPILFALGRDAEIATFARQAYHRITIAWRLLAVIGVLVAPRIGTRMGERISADENLAEAG
jgi:hypothetical protein